MDVEARFYPDFCWEIEVGIKKIKEKNKMITIKTDLTNVKVAERKKQILNVIHKWLIEYNSEKGDEFQREFLSPKHDKYFNEIKERIGEFEEIKEMSVLYFLANVIIETTSESTEFKIIKELHKDFQKLRKNFREEKIK